MDAASTPFVLVVDDEAAVRDLFASFLRRAGIDVEQAQDGVEAAGRLRLRVPDAIVCDLDMPHMDGVGFCLLLRADPATRGVPILIVSGGGGPALGRARDAGCDAVLAKPCSGAVLVATVARLLDRPSRSSIHLAAGDLREAVAAAVPVSGPAGA